MAFWCQIKHSKLKALSQQCRRWYSHVPGGVSSVYYSGGVTSIRVYIEKPNFFICQRPTDLYNTVRFFAAPVQAKPKPEAKDSSGTRINNQIKADIVRLVSDEGHVVVSLREALDRAGKLKLDLVEVQRTANPPVCKIMDFHREKYKQQVKEKDRAKGKTEVTLRKGDSKEVRFTAKTEQKDLQMKADTAKRLMEKGYRVKCMAMGKEEEDLGGMLSRLSALIEDFAIVESGPRVEKRQAYVIVRHVKFGPSKKGPPKKIAERARTEVQNAATSSQTIISSSLAQPQPIEQDWKSTGSSSESEQAESPSMSSMKRTDGKPEKSKMVWSEFGKSDDFQEIFDFDGNKSEDTKGSVPTRLTERASTDPIAEGSKFSSEQKHHFNISQGATGSGRAGPQLPYQGRQTRTPMNPASPSLQQKQLGNDASTLRTLKQPPVDNSTRKQEPRPSTTPTSPNSSYGIFSSPKPTIPSQRSTVRESNMEVNSPDSKRNPSSNRSSLNDNPAESRQKPEDKPSQGAWGIFSSRDSSSAKQNSSDGKINVQR